MIRRDFLKTASVLTAGALVGCTPKEKKESENIVDVHKTIGLQIYTLGPELYAGDLSANLKRIKDMGIDNLELAGYNPADSTIGGVELMEFKKKVEDAGLKMISSHVNPPQLFAGVAGKENKGKDGAFSASMKNDIIESWKKIADDHVKLGVQYLVEPMMPILPNEEAVKSFCEIMNLSGETVKKAGLQFGYHNHNMEFAKVVPGGKKAAFGTIFDQTEGTQILDMMLANTDPANVIFEMDVYWTVMGQNDPVEYLRKYADRIKMLHIKDRMVLGASGMMNFENIFNQFYANGLKYFWVEIEDINSGKQFERLEASIDYLKKAPFVK
jgi:sugar phosphate isomerase/epimerase